MKALLARWWSVALVARGPAPSVAPQDPALATARTRPSRSARANTAPPHPTNPSDWLRRLIQTTEGQRRLAWALVIGCVILDILVVGQHVLLRHLNYHSDAFDLGNMDQAVWNTLHGHFFRFTNRGTDWFGPPTRLAIHVEPILLLLVPFYIVVPGAVTLLVIQTVALALGAIPLFMLSLRRLPAHPMLGVAFVVAYLCSPALLGEALWDFHPVTLATPLLLAAFYAFDARRYGWMLVAGVLAAACKEDVALALIPIALLLSFRHGRPRLGLALALGALAWTSLCFVVIMPHFNAGASLGGNAYWYRYSQLGSSPASALRHVLANPLLLFGVIFSGDKLGYLALLLRTVGGLGLFAPFWLLAGLPELAINLLSTQVPQYSGFYHYNAILIAVLSVASIYGTAAIYRARTDARAGMPLPAVPARPTPAAPPNSDPPNGAPRDLASGTFARGRSAAALGAALVARWWERRLRQVPISPRWFGPILASWLLLATGWNLWATGYKIGGFWSVGYALAPNSARIATLLDRIPPTAVVAATDTLNPHLTDRETIYLLPDPLSYQAQYVAVDLLDIPPAMRAVETHMFETMLASGRYQVVGVAGPVTVIQRVGPPLAG